MNRRLLFIALFAIFSVAIFWWFTSRPDRGTLLPALQSTEPPVSTTPSPALTDIKATNPTATGGGYQGLTDPRWEWWNAMKSKDRSFEWKMPIQFFGRVVDQDNQPMQDATIRFTWTDTSLSGTSHAETVSDGAGRFSLVNKTGKALSVYVSKNGYHSSGGTGGRSFEFAAFFEGHYYQPDSERPVIFRMQKKLKTEQLVVHHLSGRIRYDELSYYDIEHGTLTQTQPRGASIALTSERSESAQGAPFDWKWKVRAENATLLETTDEFAQLAPEEGYTTSWDASQLAVDAPFRRNVKVRFYLLTANDRYALVDIQLSHPNLRSVGPSVTVDSFLNPSGSRNLEHEPK